MLSAQRARSTKYLTRGGQSWEPTEPIVGQSTQVKRQRRMCGQQGNAVIGRPQGWHADFLALALQMALVEHTIYACSRRTIAPLLGGVVHVTVESNTTTTAAARFTQHCKPAALP